MGANSQVSPNTYFETDMALPKYSVQKQHLSCLSSGHYGAVLTICSRRWGDIVLCKHGSWLSLWIWSTQSVIPPPHVRLRCDYEQTRQINNKSTSAPPAFHKHFPTHTHSNRFSCIHWYRQWNPKFSQAWCSGLVIILKYRTLPPMLKRWKSH